MKALWIATALLAGFVAGAQAQTNVNWGLQTGAEPRSLGVYDTSHTFVPTGVLDSTAHTFAPTGDGSALLVNGFPLSAVLANGGLSTNQTLTGAGPTNLCPSISANCIFISSDNSTATTGAKQVEALSIWHNYGGTGTVGGRNSLSVWSLLNSPSDPSNTNTDYVAGQFYARALSGDGGTDIGAGARGAIFGLNAYGILDGTATNFINVTGGEINVGIKAGGSSRVKSGWSIVALPYDAVQGSSYDAALMFSNQTGAVGWKNGIYFSASNGTFPMATTGTILKTSGATFANGIDFSSNTITGYAWQSPGFTVRGDGVVYVGAQLQLASNIVINFQGRNLLSSPSDGTYLMTNQAATDFTRIQFGGATASFPALHRNGANLEAKLADNSANTGIIAATVKLSAYTVAGLPSCVAGLAGTIAYVTDATAPAYNATLTGSGAVKTLAMCNGANWTAH